MSVSSYITGGEKVTRNETVLMRNHIFCARSSREVNTKYSVYFFTCTWGFGLLHLFATWPYLWKHIVTVHYIEAWLKYNKGYLSWLGKTAKSLSIFLFFYLGLITQKEVSCHKCHTTTVTWQEVTVSHHMMSHDRCGRIVHRPCSSYISSVENLTGTLSSSLCLMLNKEQLA